MAHFHLVLVRPEIPQNTGAIGRLCVSTGTRLHLVKPLGFSLEDKFVRRAGMDYWDKLDVTRYIDYEDFLQKHPSAKVWLATTKAKRTYADVSYGPDDFIMFGKESAGIPEEILVAHEEDCIRIPMLSEIRSLNLSNAVSIVLYEALRQNGFAGLEEAGQLHRLSWEQ